MKLTKDIQLTQNFKFNEFLATNDKEMPSIEKSFNIQRLSFKLQSLRDIVGSIHINSGFRGVLYNKSEKVKGSVNSKHLDGLAADIRFDFSAWNRDSMSKLLQYLGFTNVNFYWTSDRKTWVWLHVDIGNVNSGKPFSYRDLDANTQKEIAL